MVSAPLGSMTHARPALPSSAAGFTLIELLVVVAIIAVVMAIAAPALIRARMSANEGSAISSLRAIHSAQAAFSSVCARGGFAQSLDDLALPPAGSDQGFISVPLSFNGVLQSGYVANVSPDVGAVTVTATTCNNATAPAVSAYFAERHPVSIGMSGQRSFAISTGGEIFVKDDGTSIVPGMAGALLLQ